MDNGNIKAIFFDIGGTLLIGNNPRTETLVGTLENLRQNGIMLFSVSSLGVPQNLDGLLIPTPIPNAPKYVRVQSALQKHGLKPEETIYFGDDENEDGRAARINNVKFVCVEEDVRYSHQEHKVLLEAELIRVFGKNAIVGENKARDERKKEIEERRAKLADAIELAGKLDAKINTQNSGSETQDTWAYGQKYKTVILDIDRNLLNAGTQEAEALVETLRHVRENLSDVLIVASPPKTPSFAVLLGHPENFGATKSKLLSCLLANTKLMGGTLEAEDILYLSSTEEGHEDNRDFCNFVNVGNGYDGIKKALEDAFGKDVFEKAQRKAQDTKQETRGPVTTQNGNTPAKPELNPVSDLPKPKWFGARLAAVLREKCKGKSESGKKTPVRG